MNLKPVSMVIYIVLDAWAEQLKMLVLFPRTAAIVPIYEFATKLNRSQ